MCVSVCARAHVTYDFTRRDVQIVWTLRATGIDRRMYCVQSGARRTCVLTVGTDVTREKDVRIDCGH